MKLSDALKQTYAERKNIENLIYRIDKDLDPLGFKRSNRSTNHAASFNVLVYMNDKTNLRIALNRPTMAFDWLLEAELEDKVSKKITTIAKTKSYEDFMESLSKNI